ncbi:FAD dependent oxidoreductase [Hortaea werneckii]|nr:FAD dependent oxidoreductase [Hortaea werneckii]
MQALHADFEEAGGDTALASTVTRIEAPPSGDGDWKIWTAPPGSTGPQAESFDPQTHEPSTASEEDVVVTAETVINSAGLYAYGINNMILPPERHRTPYYAKGTYYSYPKSRPKPNTLIYPAPVPGHGGLGTHLTLDMAGRIRFGPDVEWITNPHDLAPSGDSARFAAALEDIQSYLPGIDVEAVAPDYAGIRPKLAPKESGGTKSGGKVTSSDFYIRREEGFPGFVNLLGMESPGLTSSLAIGEMVFRMLHR